MGAFLLRYLPSDEELGKNAHRYNKTKENKPVNSINFFYDDVSLMSFPLNL